MLMGLLDCAEAFEASAWCYSRGFAMSWCQHMTSSATTRTYKLCAVYHM